MSGASIPTLVRGQGYYDTKTPWLYMHAIHTSTKLPANVGTCLFTPVICNE